MFSPVASLLLFTVVASSTDLSCSGPDDYAATSAFVHLVNIGLLDRDDKFYGNVEVTLLASERIDRNLYEQIHRIVFTRLSGKEIEVITTNRASRKECSESGVEIYLISQHLGSEGSLE